MQLRSAALAALSLIPAAVGQTAPCLASSPGAVHLDAADENALNRIYAIRLQNGASASTITAVEVFTGETRANTDVEIWSHDAGSNAPWRWRSQASWWLSETKGWQGGVLSSPVTLAPNEVFWLVWAPPRGSQLSVEARDPVNGQPHREGTFVPNGALLTKFVWKFRLWCGGKLPGEFVVLGGPCRGSNGRAPRMLARPSVPAIGAPFELVLDAARANAPALLALGLQDQRLNGTIALPLDLGPFGAPSCYVHVDALAARVIRTDAMGFVAAPLALPPTASLIGRSVFAQWHVVDPGANALGIATSAGAQLRLGN